jgi:GNAT superfamily N-acetyltransferase
MPETAPKMEPRLGVERALEPLSPGDMADLCDATDMGIRSGGGFGWVALPARDIIKRFWAGVITMPARTLLLARLDGVVCGAAQLIRPPPNNEARAHSAQLATHFVAPWARGHGLAHALVREAIALAREEGARVLNLNVRATQGDAIRLYESMGFVRFGTHPAYARVDGRDIPGHFYHLPLVEGGTDDA